MKPSEALLLNSMACKQGIFYYVDTERNARCALGTIMLDLKSTAMITYHLNKRYHMFASYFKGCIVQNSHSLAADVMYMNDFEKKTRPEIAAWLHKQELQYGEIGPKQPIKSITNQGEQHDQNVLTCEAVDGVYQLTGTHRVYDLKS